VNSIESGPGHSASASWEPLCLAGWDQPPRKTPFSEWWLSIVFKDKSGKTFSRRDIVRHVADTDGGAHVDAGLDETYKALSRDG
jgi:hypothetical protein